MRDDLKTREQLVEELISLRQQVSRMSKVESCSMGERLDTALTSEEKLLKLQKVAGIGLLEWNLKTNRVLLSDGVRRLCGLEGQNELPTSDFIRNVVHPDDLEYVQINLQLALSGAARYNIDHRILRSDGVIVWIHAQAELSYDEKGAPALLMCTIWDITDRKRAEDELLASNELFALFMRYSPIFTFIKEVTPTQSVVLQATDNYRQMIGMSGPEMIGKTMTELFPPEFAAKIIKDDWAVVSSGDVLKLEEELNGRSYTTYKFPLVWRDKTLLAGYTIDITDRKRAENKLLYIIKAIESTSDAIGISDPQGRHFYQNKALSDLFGYETAEELEAAGGGSSVVKDPEIAKEMFTNIMSGKSWAGELEMVTKNGRVFPAFERADAIQDEEGNLIGLIGIITDITERKRAEEEKAKLEAQLQQARKMESVGRLAGGVAHDFNNILGVILGHAEMALDQVNPAQPLHADLEEIRKAASRSADLTRQLLAFARKQTIVPKVLDLNETVEGMLKMLKRLIGENIHLNWQSGKDLWLIKADPSQIDQILANLCVNARDAITDIGRITIETRNIAIDEEYCAAHADFVPGEYVILSVSDDGCGMNQETLGNIFEPFFTSKDFGKGTGLGLATVYGAVKQNSGLVDVKSQPGQGTTFAIYLPRHISKTGQAWTETPAGQLKRGQETILLVEDYPAVLNATKLMLEKQGYIVLPASTPSEAIRLASEHAGEVHLLMTDVVMPGMNGRDLAEKLLTLYPHLKRLFMSGYTADVIAPHGVLGEGIYFIQKPFSVQTLAAKVREALDGA